MNGTIYFDEAQDLTETQLQDMLVLVRPRVLVNDTRTLADKLADLSNDNLLDSMERGYADFRRYTDPYGVMSDNWLWSRWIRS